jgi:putative endonuclease
LRFVLVRHFDALQSARMFDRRYFVYMVQSSSRRALYIGFTNFLIMRVIEHRTSKYPSSFTAKYLAWRLVYYEEYGDAEAAHDRERQLKGWSRAKKNAFVEKMNPKWRDIISEWENKYGLEFRLDGRITSKVSQKQTQDPSTPVSRAEESAREPSSAQDD